MLSYIPILSVCGTHHSAVSNIWKSMLIGTWNVRRVQETGKLAIIEKEIRWTIGNPLEGISVFYVMKQ